MDMHDIGTKPTNQATEPPYPREIAAVSRGIGSDTHAFPLASSLRETIRPAGKGAIDSPAGLDELARKSGSNPLDPTHVRRAGDEEDLAAPYSAGGRRVLGIKRSWLQIDHAGYLRSLYQVCMKSWYSALALILRHHSG